MNQSKFNRKIQESLYRQFSFSQTRQRVVSSSGVDSNVSSSSTVRVTLSARNPFETSQQAAGRRTEDSHFVLDMPVGPIRNVSQLRVKHLKYLHECFYFADEGVKSRLQGSKFKFVNCVIVLNLLP